MSERETSAEIDAVAADWVVRIDSAPLSFRDQAELDRWLQGEPRRMGAYARARAMLLHARRAKALGADFDPDEFLGRQAPRTMMPAEGFSAAAHFADEDAAGGHRPCLPRRAILIGSSGLLGAGALAALGLSWPAAAQTYTTKRGEIRLVPLAEGSTMTLNTASTARVILADRTCHIELVEGEALFDVSSETIRPFIIEAGDTRVHATATSFTVSRLFQRPVEVLVRHGTVEVERRGSPAIKSVISANKRATVSGFEPVAVATVPASQMSRELAWREGMLSFEDRPLREAAGEFARYSDTPILFEDPAIGDEAVTGLFAANNPAGFAKSAALSLGLDFHSSASGIVLSRPK